MAYLKEGILFEGTLGGKEYYVHHDITFPLCTEASKKELGKMGVFVRAVPLDFFNGINSVFISLWV